MTSEIEDCLEEHGTPLPPPRAALRRLYHGRTPAAIRFQYAVIAIDLAIIAFFIATPVLQDEPSFLWLDYSVAALLGLDLAARALASRDIGRWLAQPRIWLDFFILLTLLLPTTLANLGFLRIVRLWSMSRSGFLWRPLEQAGLGRWRDTGHAFVNLITFLFVMTGFLYTFFFRKGAGFADYIDALYFTVTAATTTGFGDIVLPGPWGKLTAIIVMISGISLLARLAQSVFRPPKVFFPCPQCALQRHDPDAVHCKAFGHVLRIPDEGNWGA
jgi:voltage-gated potassium channel